MSYISCLVSFFRHVLRIRTIYLLIMCICAGTWCHGTCVKVRGQPVGVSSPLLPSSGLPASIFTWRPISWAQKQDFFFKGKEFLLFSIVCFRIFPLKIYILKNIFSVHWKTFIFDKIEGRRAMLNSQGPFENENTTKRWNTKNFRSHET